MNKLERAFSNGKAFIPFITAGDPSLEITEQLVYRMAEAGADLIELGIPFSDPVAEDLLFRRQITVPFRRVLQRTRFLTWWDAYVNPAIYLLLL